jgi:hypothetical protein
MKRLFAICALLFLTACAATTVTVNHSLQGGYQLINSYVTVMYSAYQRGRIDEPTARTAIERARKAEEVVDAAVVALGACKPPACDPTQILQSIQPMLMELERDLRAEQAKQSAKGNQL